MKLNCGPTPWEKWEASEKWHRWFAWRPVQVDSHDCRWLEYVERKRRGSRAWDYRALEEKGDLGA